MIIPATTRIGLNTLVMDWVTENALPTDGILGPVSETPAAYFMDYDMGRQGTLHFYFYHDTKELWEVVKYDIDACKGITLYPAPLKKGT